MLSKALTSLGERKSKMIKVILLIFVVAVPAIIGVHNLHRPFQVSDNSYPIALVQSKRNGNSVIKIFPDLYPNPASYILADSSVMLLDTPASTDYVYFIEKKRGQELAQIGRIGITNGTFEYVYTDVAFVNDNMPIALLDNKLYSYRVLSPTTGYIIIYDLVSLATTTLKIPVKNKYSLKTFFVPVVSLHGDILIGTLSDDYERSLICLSPTRGVLCEISALTGCWYDDDTIIYIGVDKIVSLHDLTSNVSVPLHTTHGRESIILKDVRIANNMTFSKKKEELVVDTYAKSKALLFFELDSMKLQLLKVSTKNGNRSLQCPVIDLQSRWIAID